MNFGEVIGCQISHWIEDDSFLKCYENIDQYHWNRIKSISLLLAEHKIGPAVKYIDEKCFIIAYQIVVPFNNFTPVLIQDIKEKINLLIDKMHSLGYGHGDLHIDNIGYLNEDLFLLDHDSSYFIEDSYHDMNLLSQWLLTWMQEGHDWDGSFEEFVAQDYNTWRTDWLF